MALSNNLLVITQTYTESGSKESRSYAKMCVFCNFLFNLFNGIKMVAFDLKSNNHNLWCLFNIF